MRKIKLKFKIIFFVTVFIVVAYMVRIKKIDIIGNEKESIETIENIVFPYDFTKISLYCFIKSKISNLKYNRPNIKKLEIKFRSPIWVEIYVTEKPIIGYIRYKTDYYYFNEDLYILEKDELKNKNYIEIVGVSVDKSDVETYLDLGNGNANYIIKKIAEYKDEIEMNIDNIDFTKNDEIKIVGENLFINIGDGKFIEEKIGLMVDIYPKIVGMSGELDLSKVKTGKDKGEYIFKKY